jgi:Icc protein
MRAVLWLLLALAGCLDPAGERALRDRQIGRAAQASSQVEVEGGLAAVRALGPRRLVLWAQAPSLSARLVPGSNVGRWTVVTQNVLADATLTARAASGTVAVTLVDQPFATEKWWQLEATSEELQLALAPSDVDDTEPFRFAAFADVQEHLYEVEDLFFRMNRDPRIRFALISGDLTEHGTFEELQEFQAKMKGLNVPAFATVGNHELGAPRVWFQDLFGRASFSFAFRGVRFTLLDSGSAMVSAEVHPELSGWLELGRDRPHVVLTHLPPIDPVGVRNGSFASRSEAAQLLSMFASAGVDLTVYGHVHSYYAFSNANIPAFITGGGGAIPERFDGIGRHYLAVDVDPLRTGFEVSLVRIVDEE